MAQQTRSEGDLFLMQVSLHERNHNCHYQNNNRCWNGCIVEYGMGICHKRSSRYFVLRASSLSRFHARASSTPAMIISVVNMPVLVIKSCILIIPVV